MFEVKTNPDDPKQVQPKTIMVLGLVALVLWLGSSCWFTVRPEERGVVLRFGKLDRTVNPGLNFKLPLGIEEVYKIPVQRQLKEEFGFRTKRPGISTRYSAQGFQNESLMLTGDLNAAEVDWSVQYRIDDAYKYLFKVRNAQGTLRDISEAVMRGIIGDRTVNAVLTTGRQEISAIVKDEIQKLCDQYEIGIRIDQVVLQDVTPPDPVKPSFNRVNEAQQEREKLINQALAEYNKVIPRARGEAEQTIQQARGYAVERINEAKGRVARFNDLFIEYEKYPEVTKQRLYLETLSEVLPKVERKLIIDENTKGLIPLLQLGNGNITGAGK